MIQETISILGCGWLGLPLAEKLLSVGYRVKGSATSAEKVASLKEKGIEAYQLELNPAIIGNSHDLLQADTLIINIPPRASRLGEDFHPKQIRHLVEAIQPSPVKHIIFVSSTSIYPELNRVVYEYDVQEPGQSATPALVEAEELVQKLSPERSILILRCGGLLGYDRIPGKYVAGKTIDTGAVPVNYLHRDDAVGILQNLIENKLTGVFNAISPEHPTRESIYRKNCADFGYTLPTFVRPEEPNSYKIISPDKLLNATTYQFRYADPLQFYYVV